MEEEEARQFLGTFVEEFSAALTEDTPLPVSPLSRKVSLEELHGESLELGLRLLAARHVMSDKRFEELLVGQEKIAWKAFKDVDNFLGDYRAPNYIEAIDKLLHAYQKMKSNMSLRGAPPRLGSLLCQAAYSQLQQIDLSPFHFPQEAEADQEENKEERRAVLLQSEAVQRVFLNKLIEVALTWHRNLPRLPLCPSRKLQCSVHAIRNTRRKMEDKHLVLAEFNQLFGIQDGVDRAYYAVFDGHGGVDAATYAATHLHVALNKQEMLQSDAATAFKTAFRHTDDMFRDKAKRERLRSGSTGVAVLIQGQELTAAWLGDSQAILVRDGQVVALTDPHKPEREDEKERIEDLGGCITFMGCWRVNGTYAVSRAIGDFDQKPFVSGDADCLAVQLQGDEDYVLLACDGFFDAIKASAVPHLVLDALKLAGEPEGGDAPLEHPEDNVGARVAQQLVGDAKAAGSSDNITVMVVFLRPPEQLLTQQSATGSARALQQSASQDAPQP